MPHKVTAPVSWFWVNYLVELVFCLGKVSSMILRVSGKFLCLFSSCPLSCHYLLPKHSQPSPQFKSLNLLKCKQSWEGNTVSMINHLHLSLKESLPRIGWMKKEGRVQRKKWVAHSESIFGKAGHADMGPGWVNEVRRPLCFIRNDDETVVFSLEEKRLGPWLSVVWGNTCGRRSQFTQQYFRAWNTDHYVGVLS